MMTPTPREEPPKAPAITHTAAARIDLDNGNRRQKPATAGAWKPQPSETFERHLKAAQTAARVDAIPRITLDEKTKKPELPELPPSDDASAQFLWVTAVMARDPAHPFIAGRRSGRDGPDGQVRLERRNAPPTIIEQARRLNTSRLLVETLCWQRIKTDGPPYGWTDAQCRLIAYVVASICDNDAAVTATEETLQILGRFLDVAFLNDGPLTTYGTSGQRYEAAEALRSDSYAANYFRDVNTGEYVIGVSDLEEVARRYLGKGLPRGWLASQMDDLGWERLELQGYALPGRAGRLSGPHARRWVYRGLLPAPHADADCA